MNSGEDIEGAGKHLDLQKTFTVVEKKKKLSTVCKRERKSLETRGENIGKFGNHSNLEGTTLSGRHLGLKKIRKKIKKKSKV